MMPFSSSPTAPELDLPVPSRQQSLCFYQNSTRSLQILRIQNTTQGYLHKIAFPGQRLLFEADPQALLEIYSTAEGKETLVDEIVCDRLQVTLKNASE